MFEFVDEVDHIFTHGRTMDAKHILSSFHMCIFSLNRENPNTHVTITSRYSGLTLFRKKTTTKKQTNKGGGGVHLLTSTFSTTCLPKEQTFVETLMVMFSVPLYWLLTP